MSTHHTRISDPQELSRHFELMTAFAKRIEQNAVEFGIVNGRQAIHNLRVEARLCAADLDRIADRLVREQLEQLNLQVAECRAAAGSAWARLSNL